MFIFTSSPSSLIFFISFFLLYSISGISIHVHSSHLPDGVKIVGDKHINEELSWIWRSVDVEGGQANTTLVLARERTRRIDIFNHFECYNGGWNISNPDYILSVVSTSIPFLVVAATCLLCIIHLRYPMYHCHNRWLCCFVL
ncbi:hypothetical protein P8452_77200 [Trifolium repens]|nr:hypothetical protein P8452_77200 [Trifolium repens]